MMGTLAKEYASQFLKAHDAVVQAVQECPVANWSNLCVGENESIGAVANHIAAGYGLELQLLTASLTGQPVPTVYVVEGALDAYHAQESQRFSRYTKDETLSNLRQNAEKVHHFLSEMDDAALSKAVDTPMIVKWFGRPITVEAVIKFLLIGHPQDHLTSIRKALGR